MRRLATLVAACCCVAALAGCTQDDPQPNYSSVTPPPSPSTSVSAAPTDIPTTGPNVNPGDAPPVLSSDATLDSGDAAQSFEAYYVKLVDWAYATSQVGFLSPVYAQTCDSCASFVTNISDQLKDHRTFKGSRISINRLGLVKNDGRHGAIYAVSAEISASAIEIVDVSGNVVTQGPATSLTLTNWLIFTNGSWMIVDQGKA